MTPPAPTLSPRPRPRVCWDRTHHRRRRRLPLGLVRSYTPGSRSAPEAWSHNRMEHVTFGGSVGVVWLLRSSTTLTHTSSPLPTDTLQSRDAILVGVILGESEVFAHLAGRHQPVTSKIREPDTKTPRLHLSNRGAVRGVERGRFVAEGRASSTPTTIRILQRRRFGSVRVEILPRALIDESHRKTHRARLRRSRRGEPPPP